MSTDRQKSFIAELATSLGHLHFPGLTHAGPVTTPIRGIFDITPSWVDVSNFLCIAPEKERADLKFYFRCTNNYYHIYLRTPGTYYGKTLGFNDGDILIAATHDAAGTFNFLDKSNNIVTLDNFTTDKCAVRLQTTQGNTLTQRKKTQQGYFIRRDGGIVVDFYLNIIERNAAYLDNPDEI